MLEIWRQLCSCFVDTLVVLVDSIHAFGHRVDSRFALSQWEAPLLCNAVSHWLGASLESVLGHINAIGAMGLLPETSNCGSRMHRESRERFPRRRHQRKPRVSNPGMHHDTCVTAICQETNSKTSRAYVEITKDVDKMSPCPTLTKQNTTYKACLHIADIYLSPKTF